MVNESYSEKLKDPRWQKKRLEILNRDGWTCKKCGAKDKTLHVHHIFYSPGKDPWEIRNGFLVTLCEDCHELEKGTDPQDSLIEEVGNFLNFFWSSEYDIPDLTNLAEGLFYEKRKNHPLVGIRLLSEYLNLEGKRFGEWKKAHRFFSLSDYLIKGKEDISGVVAYLKQAFAYPKNKG